MGYKLIENSSTFWDASNGSIKKTFLHIKYWEKYDYKKMLFFPKKHKI